MSSAAAANVAPSSANGQRHRDPEQDPAERRPRELVGDDLAAVHAAVRGRELRGRHEPGQERLRRVVEERLRDAHGQEDGVEHREPDRVGAGQHRDERERGGTEEVGAHHHPPPVPAVDQRARDEREQQPGEPLGDRQPGDLPRVVRQVRGEQGTRRQRHPVAQVRDRRGGPQARVRAAEPVGHRATLPDAQHVPLKAEVRSGP